MDQVYQDHEMFLPGGARVREGPSKGALRRSCILQACRVCQVLCRAQAAWEWESLQLKQAGKTLSCERPLSNLDPCSTRKRNGQGQTVRRGQATGVAAERRYGDNEASRERGDEVTNEATASPGADGLEGDQLAAAQWGPSGPARSVR